MSNDWNIGRLRAAQPTATSFTMTAQSISLYNPNTASSRQYAPGQVGSLTCSISTTGAGGRDTATAFQGDGLPGTQPDNVWFYFISGSAVALSTLCSKTGPLQDRGGGVLGPVLPTGYTEYAPGFPVVISDNNDLRHDSRQGDEGTRCTFQGSMSGTTLTVNTISSGSLSVGDVIRENPAATSTALPHTTIISQLTGAPGSTGTYQISRSQTTGFDIWDATQPYPTGLKVFDDEAWFTATILLNQTDNVHFGPPPPPDYEWDYRPWIPIDAVRFNVELDAEVSTTDPIDQFTGAFVVKWAEIGTCDGNDVNLSTYSFGHRQPFPQNDTLDFPVTSAGTLVLQWINGNGAAPEQTTVLFLRGYKF